VRTPRGATPAEGRAAIPGEGPSRVSRSDGRAANGPCLPPGSRIWRRITTVPARAPPLGGQPANRAGAPRPTKLVTTVVTARRRGPATSPPRHHHQVSVAARTVVVNHRRYWRGKSAGGRRARGGPAARPPTGGASAEYCRASCQRRAVAEASGDHARGAFPRARAATGNKAKKQPAGRRVFPTGGDARHGRGAAGRRRRHAAWHVAAKGRNSRRACGAPPPRPCPSVRPSPKGRRGVDSHRRGCVAPPPTGGPTRGATTVRRPRWWHATRAGQPLGGVRRCAARPLWARARGTAARRARRGVAAGAARRRRGATRRARAGVQRQRPPTVRPTPLVSLPASRPPPPPLRQSG